MLLLFRRSVKMTLMMIVRTRTKLRLSRLHRLRRCHQRVHRGIYYLGNRQVSHLWSHPPVEVHCKLIYSSDATAISIARRDLFVNIDLFCEPISLQVSVPAQFGLKVLTVWDLCRFQLLTLWNSPVRVDRNSGTVWPSVKRPALFPVLRRRSVASEVVSRGACSLFIGLRNALCQLVDNILQCPLLHSNPPLLLWHLGTLNPICFLFTHLMHTLVLYYYLKQMSGSHITYNLENFSWSAEKNI